MQPPGGTRTHNLAFVKGLLYPLSYGGQADCTPRRSGPRRYGGQKQPSPSSTLALHAPDHLLEPGRGELDPPRLQYGRRFEVIAVALRSW